MEGGGGERQQDRLLAEFGGDGNDAGAGRDEL